MKTEEEILKEHFKNQLKSDTVNINEIIRYAKIEEKYFEIILNIVLESNNPYYICYFAADVKGAPIGKLAEGIITIGNAEYIYRFARGIKGAPIDKLAERIITTGNAEYIYYFARDVKGAPIDKLAEGIITTGNAEYIYRFARNVKGAPIDKLVEGLIATGNAIYIYRFADDVKGAPIDKLVEGLIATGNAEYIYYFARDVKGAPIEKLAEALLKTKNSQYIYYFELCIADGVKILEAIKVRNNSYDNIDNNLTNFNKFNAIKLANLSLSDKKKLLKYLDDILFENQAAILFLQVYEEILTENKECSLEECRFLDDCYNQALYQRLTVKNKNVLDFDNSFTKIHNEIMNDNGLNKSVKKLYMKKDKILKKES